MARCPDTASPPTPPAKGLFRAQVAANEPLCTRHGELILRFDAFPPARPGQFLQIRCDEPEGPLGYGPALIRRPFSIGGLRRGPGGVEIDILYRVSGLGTGWMSRLKPGEPVSVLGPLGQCFQPPPPGSMACLVAGGIGLPPLIWLAGELAEAGIPALAFCGARTADVLPLRRDPTVPVRGAEPSAAWPVFARHGVPAVIATDDGSLGARGRLPDVLAGWLEQRLPDAPRPAVFTCGPEPMMQAVAEICRRRNLPCQVCLERMMACGMGTCQSCVVPVRDASAADGWRYRLCCTDGPVFPAEQVIWSAPCETGTQLF